MSRASVREALRVLDYIGVVEVRPGEGTFVATTPPTPFDPSLYSLLSERTFLLDVLEARRIVEDEVVLLAARRGTRDDFDAMEEFLSHRDDDLAAGKHDLASDLAFHVMVAESTGNPVLVSLMRQLNEMWLQTREKTGRRRSSPASAHHFHRQILTALRKRQAVAVRRWMRRHLQEMRVDILGK